MMWLIFVVIIAFVFMGLTMFTNVLKKNSNQDERIAEGKTQRIIRIILSIIFVLVTILLSVNAIPAGYTGIVYQFGSIKGQISEGLQFVLPWRNVKSVCIQTTSHKFPQLTCFSEETQAVYIGATLNISVAASGIQNLYRTVGENWFNVVVKPRVMQNFKDETVKYKSVDIAPNREMIRHNVSNRLKVELQPYSITVIDLLLDNIDFEAGFKQAIENKQIATQNALEEEQKVVVERNKAQQKIEEAKGKGQAVLEVAEKQAEANNKINSTLSQNMIMWEYVQKLSPNVEVMMVPSNQGFLIDPKGMIQGK